MQQSTVEHPLGGYWKRSAASLNPEERIWGICWRPRCEFYKIAPMEGLEGYHGRILGCAWGCPWAPFGHPLESLWPCLGAPMGSLWPALGSPAAFAAFSHNWITFKGNVETHWKAQETRASGKSLLAPEEPVEVVARSAVRVLHTLGVRMT